MRSRWSEELSKPLHHQGAAPEPKKPATPRDWETLELQAVAVFLTQVLLWKAKSNLVVKDLEMVESL